MAFDPTTAIPVIERPDGLLEKDNFNPATATPVSDIPQLRNNPDAKYHPPLNDQDRARAVVELMYREKGKKVPLARKIDWSLTSTEARARTSAALSTVITGGLYPVVQGLRGIADNKEDYTLMDAATKGILYPEETKRITDPLMAKDAPGWAKVTQSISEDILAYGLTGMVKGMIESKLIVRDLARRLDQAGTKFAEEKVGSITSGEGVLEKQAANLAQKIDQVKSGYIDDVLGRMSAVDTTTLKTGFQEFAKSRSMIRMIADEMNAGGVSVGLSIKPVVGQTVSFASAEGKTLIGKIVEIAGNRATIDMEGRQIIAMLSQLRVPEIPKIEGGDLVGKSEEGQEGQEILKIDKDQEIKNYKTAEEYVASKIEGYQQSLLPKSIEETSISPLQVGKGWEQDRGTMPGEPIGIYKNKFAISESTDDRGNVLYEVTDDEGKNYGEFETIPQAQRTAEKISELISEWEAAQSKEMTTSNPPPIEPPTPPSTGNKYDDNRNYFNTFKKPSTLGKDVAEFIDKTFVPISTRLSKIDESLKDVIRQHAFKVNMTTKADMDASLPFMQSMAKMERNDMIDLDFALKNADIPVVDKITEKYGIQEQYQNMRKTLDGIYERAKNAGMDVGYIEDYFPRRIVDVNEYLKFLRKNEEWGAISKAFQEERALLGRDLKEEEKAEIINTMIRGYGKDKIAINKPGNIKERKIIELKPEMNAFYKDSGVALSEYIRSMNDNIEARVFFGKEKNLENSIGNYVARLVDDQIINAADELNVKQILKSYFDKRGTHGIVTGFKNFSYIATMGSPISAVTQIGDLAFSLYKNGFYGTVKAALKSDKVTKQDIGLDLIAEEFTDQSKSSKAVSKVFKMIGLDAMDAFGKEVMINGAFDRLSAKAVKGDTELMKTLQRVFGAKAEDVMLDLKNQVPTDDVKYMLFSELADFQPIALTEMPEYYVKGGNMRIFYMLKSYTIKQLDVYHNEIFREKDGKKAVKKALALALALAFMGATSDKIKDILLGRKTKLNDLVIDNMLKLVGFSKWQLYKTRQDGLFQTLLESILPPVPFLDDIYKDAMRFTNKNKKNRPDFDELRIWQRIPIVGKFYYWWFGGGEEIKKKKDKKKIRD